MKSLSTNFRAVSLSVVLILIASFAYSNPTVDNSKNTTEITDIKSDTRGNLVFKEKAKKSEIFDFGFKNDLFEVRGFTDNTSPLLTPDCDNVDNGGTIGGSVSSSGPLNGPITISNIASPEGGTGELEIVWMMSHVDVPNFEGSEFWSQVPGEFGLTLTIPGPITQDTYYIRCARRAGCTDFFTGESNQVAITILPQPLAVIDCADITQNSSETTVDNSHPICGTHPTYAFWSGNLLSGSKYWTISNGVFDEFANGSASFTGTVTNTDNANWIFDLNVVFSGKTFTPPANSPKSGNCVSDVSNVDWYYYTSTAGVLTGSGALNGAVVELSRMGEAFQVGEGAHLNDPSVYGASGWLNFHILSQPTNGPTLETNNAHGDFNFELPQGPGLLDIPSCNAICAGETVELFASGVVGIAPFTYSWNTGDISPSISVSPNLTSTYTVTVTDANGSETTTSIEVTVLPQIELSCNSTDASEWQAADGSVGIIANGGVEPYTYLWNTGTTTSSIQNVAAGVYSVLVTDANGCTAWSECCVNQPPMPLQCTGYRTQTQGGWGSSPNGGNPGAYLHANFAQGFPSGIEIGCDNTFTFTTAQSITDFLPCGGSASSLPIGNAIDPNCPGNVFISQVLAATISIGFDDNIPTYSSGLVPLRELVVLYGTFAGWTVEELLIEANLKLGGCSSSYSFSELNDAVTAVNENYVDGNVSGDYLDCCILSVTCIPTNGDCTNNNQGSISATFNESYLYEWVNDTHPNVVISNGATISNLGAGSYTVTVTDESGCSNTCSSTITVEPCCNVTDPGEIGGGDIACGQIDGPIIIGSVADPSGGVGDLEIVWMTSNVDVPNIVGNTDWSLVPGEDGLTLTIPGPITENTYYIRCARRVGCDNFFTGESNTISFVVNPLPVIECSATDVVCGVNGSVATTDNSDYSYIWTNAADEVVGNAASVLSLPAGTYTVVVTDENGCTATCNATIADQPALAIDCSSTNGECGGLGSASVEVLTGGGDYTYEWSNGETSALISGLANGSYSVVVTDANGCTDECQVIITNEAALTVQCSEGDDVCQGERLVQELLPFRLLQVLLLIPMSGVTAIQLLISLDLKLELIL